MVKKVDFYLKSYTSFSFEYEVNEWMAIYLWGEQLAKYAKKMMKFRDEKEEGRFVVGVRGCLP